jgi:hypothetical protein
MMENPGLYDPELHGVIETTVSLLNKYFEFAEEEDSTSLVAVYYNWLFQLSSEQF